MHLAIPFLTIFLATASALDCQSPPSPSTINLCNDWTVRWDYVNTDPTEFCIYLSNYELGYPPHAIQVAGPVNRNNRRATVPGQCRPELGTSQHRVWLSACNAPLTIYDQCDPITIQQPCCRVSRVNARSREFEVDE